MAGLQGQALAQIVQRLGLLLPRQAVHQIQVDPLETGAATNHLVRIETTADLGAQGAILLHQPSPPHRLQRRGAVVDTTESRQGGIVEALHTDGQAIDPGTAEAAKAGRVDGAGVRLQGDLDVGRQIQQLVQQFDDAGHGIGAEQARRAAADEQAAHHASLDGIELLPQILLEPGDERPFGQLALERMGVEVAVRTLARAPGHVQIDGQRGQRRCGRGFDAHSRSAKRSSRLSSARTAAPRCDTRAFSCRDSSAALRPLAASRNKGS